MNSREVLVDACEVPGKRTPMKDHWHTWRIEAEIKKSLPPRTPRKPPIICAGLPPDAKVGDKVSLSVHFEGDPEDCYGNIDVMIIALSSTELIVSTQNPDPWNITPEDENCPDICGSILIKYGRFMAHLLAGMWPNARNTAQRIAT